MKKIEIKVINKNKTEKVEERKIIWLISQLSEKYSVEIIDYAININKSNLK